MSVQQRIQPTGFLAIKASKCVTFLLFFSIKINIKNFTMNKSLIIQSKLDEINQVEKIIDEISEVNSIHSDLYGKILIATIEGVNNAMVHGNKLDINKTVKIDFTVVNGKLTIAIEDQGPGFDFNSIPDPTMPENIENISGRGVFLMRKLTDELVYNDKGTKVELIFNI